MLGVLPGIIGSLQANEALKLALGIGDPLVGRLLLFDALETRWDEMRVRRNPDCPVCGEHPTITEYIDYVEFCAGPGACGGHVSTIRIPPTLRAEVGRRAPGRGRRRERARRPRGPDGALPGAPRPDLGGRPASRSS